MVDIKLLSRYIVPFAYTGVAFDNLNDKSKSWVLAPKTTTESDVYEYVRNSFITADNESTDDHSMKIGSLYEYEGIKPGDNFWLKYIHDDYHVKFYIRKVYLALFQTGIGFLWFTPEIKGEFDSLEEAIDFNYHMKELSRDEESNFIFKEEVRDIVGNEDIPADMVIPGGKKYKVDEPFFLGILIDDITSSINDSITYYPSRSRKNRILPDKSVLFQCGVIPKTMNPERNLVYLTRGYKTTYQLADDYKAQMYKPFDNVRYYTASEGCGYFVLTDSDTPEFFKDLTKVNNDYFYMFLLAMYQNYTLLHYSELISNKLSSARNDYERYSKDLEENLDDITTELNIFLAKSVYSSVSHIQHQNEFFHYVSDRLMIRENISSVTAGIEALNNIEGDLYEEEIQKRNHFLEGCLTIVSGLALFSAFNDVNELLINHIYRLFPGMNPLLTYIFNAGLLLITIFIVGKLIQYIKYNPDKKKKKSDKRKRT